MPQSPDGVASPSSAGVVGAEEALPDVVAGRPSRPITTGEFPARVADDVDDESSSTAGDSAPLPETTGIARTSADDRRRHQGAEREPPEPRRHGAAQRGAQEP